MIFKNKKNGQVANIVDEDLIKEFSSSIDWEIGTEEDLPKPVEPVVTELTYGEKVDMLIRRKYTLSEELSILRQRNVKAEEYQQYFDYCEQCKIEAKGGI